MKRIAVGAGLALMVTTAITSTVTSPTQALDFTGSGCTYSGNVSVLDQRQDRYAGFQHCVQIVGGQGRHLWNVHSVVVPNAQSWPKKCTAYPRIWNDAGKENGKPFGKNGPTRSCAEWKSDYGLRHKWGFDVYLKKGPIYTTWIFSNGRTAYAAARGVY
jgi:hypothetical protein